jgi:hypothetical protein
MMRQLDVSKKKHIDLILIDKIKMVPANGSQLAISQL